MTSQTDASMNTRAEPQLAHQAIALVLSLVVDLEVSCLPVFEPCL